MTLPILPDSTAYYTKSHRKIQTLFFLPYTNLTKFFPGSGKGQRRGQGFAGDLKKYEKRA
jgi:hypothetical protein